MTIGLPQKEQKLLTTFLSNVVWALQEEHLTVNISIVGVDWLTFSMYWFRSSSSISSVFNCISFFAPQYSQVKLWVPGANVSFAPQLLHKNSC